MMAVEVLGIQVKYAKLMVNLRIVLSTQACLSTQGQSDKNNFIIRLGLGEAAKTLPFGNDALHSFEGCSNQLFEFYIKHH